MGNWNCLGPCSWRRLCPKPGYLAMGVLPQPLCRRCCGSDILYRTAGLPSSYRYSTPHSLGHVGLCWCRAVLRNILMHHDGNEFWRCVVALERWPQYRTLCAIWRAFCYILPSAGLHYQNDYGAPNLPDAFLQELHNGYSIRHNEYVFMPYCSFWVTKRRFLTDLLTPGSVCRLWLLY